MNSFRNQLLLFFILCISGTIYAQKGVKVYTEQTKEGFAVYADNPEHCIVTVVIDFQLKNIKLEGSGQATFLLNKNSKKTLLTTAASLDKFKPSKFGYTYSYSLGDANKSDFDTDFAYALPFEKGASFTLHQGYNGSFSHQNENALDFTMPVSTPITAVRDGIVVAIVENNVLACPKKECAKYNNYVTIFHSDGTFAEYAHLKRNGVLPKLGDAVTAGEVIALSGNTGYSSGPHLHLIIYLQKSKKRETLPTLFKVNDGTTTTLLKEKETYSKAY
ncbi:M23 family metallopeptidase [Flavobacterium sp. SM2513]|uniref:M23 family metallopeptidase n=1 Tax=Flavobacterium sp. SM2513 TaxID=3424766 RepID=UPI003D7F476F